MSSLKETIKSQKAEWLVTAPSFLWLALFFAVPARCLRRL
jgi:hypothetical protein